MSVQRWDSAAVVNSIGILLTRPTSKTLDAGLLPCPCCGLYCCCVTYSLTTKVHAQQQQLGHDIVAAAVAHGTRAIKKGHVQDGFEAAGGAETIIDVLVEFMDFNER